MDLKEFGRLLKEERLRQGLEITDVMDKTKISRMNLLAIEEGNEQALPHPVYAKGFVKNYARFLGMDADKMGNTLAQIYVSQEESEYDDLVLADAKKLPGVRESWPNLPLVAAVLVVLLLLVGGLVVFQDNIRGLFSGGSGDDPPATVVGRPGADSFPGFPPAAERSQEEPSPALEDDPDSLSFPSLNEEPVGDAPDEDGLPELPMQSETPGDPSAVVPELQVPTEIQEEIQETEPAAPESPGVAAQELLEQPEESTVETDQPEALSTAEQQAQEPLVRQEARLAPSGVEKTLEIRATENCWLSAQADNARAREAFLRPGERFVITFENTLELRLGNAGGVDLFFDGEQWPLSAQSGEVLTLSFP